MNLKRFAIILVIVLSVMLCISAVSAEENSTEATPDDAQKDVAADNTQKTADTSKAVKPIKTDVDADDVVVVHKKKGYFKVKVENDKTDKPVKKLKLKLKVYTKSKSKTYKITTNSKGIAKFNTKKLGLGNHKVVITSDDDKYKVNKKAKIFVGKKHTITLKPNTSKKLKNKDVLKVYTKNDEDEKDIKVAFKGKAKKTNILKAVFYLKNTKTGKIVKKVDFTDSDDGKWDYPDTDYSIYRYTAVKVKITYVTI